MSVVVGLIWLAAALFGKGADHPWLEGWRRLSPRTVPAPHPATVSPLPFLRASDHALPPRFELVLRRPRGTDLGGLSLTFVTAAYLFYPRQVFPLLSDEDLRVLWLAPDVRKRVEAHRAEIGARRQLPVGVAAWGLEGGCRLEELPHWVPALDDGAGGCLFVPPGRRKR